MSLKSLSTLEYDAIFFNFSFDSNYFFKNNKKTENLNSPPLFASGPNVQNFKNK